MFKKTDSTRTVTAAHQPTTTSQQPPISNHQPTTTSQQSRRGVLLLVVLSMLVMFMMMGVAFLVMAKHYAGSAKAVSKTDTVAASEPDDLLEAALYDILRDTNNPLSRVRYHSLLRDLYGVDGFEKELVADAFSLAATGDQFIRLQVESSGNLSQIDGYYNGRVLTMKSGPVRGLSTRIVGYKAVGTSGDAEFTVMAFDSDVDVTTIVAGNEFQVNGAPFNGTGFGYDRTANPLLSAMENVGGVNQRIALLPNGVFLDPEMLEPTFLMTEEELGPPSYASQPMQFGDLTSADQDTFRDRAASLGLSGLGGSDESYDAADFQNMLLALVPMAPELPTDETNPLMPIVDPFNPTNLDSIVQPSLHRRALINYWLHKGAETERDFLINDKYNQVAVWNRTQKELNILGETGFTAADAALGRKIILRPLPFDHPNFPKLTSLVNGPWDVDNDGDGVPDSIWVDLGYPVMKDADGRQFKPMFAILCQDLDGRLNVNAHGSLEEVIRGRFGTENQVVLAGNAYANDRPAGQGYGPAEISLRALFPGAQYADILQGNANNLGRYGFDHMPGWEGRNGGVWDLRAQMRFAQYPFRYRPSAVRRGFLTPPDLKGQFGLGVDYHGQPNFGFLGDNRHSSFDEPDTGDFNTMVSESAYESNLLSDGSYGPSTTSADALFTVAELERVLRTYDADADELAGRLNDLAPNLAANRQAVTTLSFDLPVPSVSLTADMRSAISSFNFSVAPLDALPQPMIDRLQNGSNLTISDLLVVRILKTAVDNGTPIPDVNMIIRQLLAQDLIDGLRMDLNRQFGDSRDNDNDGAVDNPEEAGRDHFIDPDRTDRMDNLYANDSSNAEQVSDTSNADFAPVGLSPTYDTSTSVRLDHTQGVDADGDNRINGLNAFGAGKFDGSDSRLARQVYARHLYVLAMLLVDESYQFPKVGGGTLTTKQTAHRLAQWAVNVVDFRDPDAIMTGFEYDVNPFDGWDVDGNVADTNGPDRNNGTADDDKTADRRVVWGSERPHLLLTETLAFHDLRVFDSAHDTGGSKTRGTTASGDDDLDQHRVPQGSAFFELLCAGNPNNAVMPRELYQYDTDPVDGREKWMLDLGRMAEDDAVWRLAISERHASAADSVVQGFLAEPEATTFQPNAMELGSDALPTAGKTVDIERYVWFASSNPSASRFPNASKNTFWNRTTGPEVLVPAGKFAVVGPREETAISSNTVADAMIPRDASNLRIHLQPDSVIVDHGTPDVPSHASFSPQPNTNIKSAVGIVAEMYVTPLGWNGKRRVGVNISEPKDPATKYYPKPENEAGNPDPDNQTADLYGDFADPSKLFPDTPVDLRVTDNTPINQLGTVLIGTHENVRTVFLQRLANPTQPWNPPADDPIHGGSYDSTLPVNPYFTVDWQPIDLSVFNGDEKPNDGTITPDGTFISGTPGPAVLRTGDHSDIVLASRERGARRNGQEENGWIAWSRNTRVNLDDSDVNRNAHTSSFFQHNLIDTLGYLNNAYGDPISPATINAAVGTITDVIARNATRANQIGAPQKPFSWITWNDRPFVSQLEMMLVPMSAPGRLTAEHTGDADAALNPFDPNQGSSDDRITNPNATYAHLLNFLASSTTTNSESDLYRLFDYTGVPSRFVGTETFLNPIEFNSGNGIDDGTEHRRPPFNSISSYREPGKINSNTIISEMVFDSLFHRANTNPKLHHPGPTFAQGIANRRGYSTGSGGSLLMLNDQYPSFFTNPFRSSNAGDMVPLANMTRTGIECTLLRSDSSTNVPTNNPLWYKTSAMDYDHTDRNPYFRYQPAQRLANLTTTRSNVYAVWITVGYFEVEEVSQDIRDRYDMGIPAQKTLFNRLYPEAVMLGRELGIDTGDVGRHRSFSIIDRSIPVGFAPGENLNVDKAILLNRTIE